MRKADAELILRTRQLAGIHWHPDKILRFVILAARIGAPGDDQGPLLLGWDEEYRVSAEREFFASNCNRDVDERCHRLAPQRPNSVISCLNTGFLELAVIRWYSTASCFVESKLHVAVACEIVPCANSVGARRSRAQTPKRELKAMHHISSTSERRRRAVSCLVRGLAGSN